MMGLEDDPASFWGPVKDLQGRAVELEESINFVS